MHNQWEEMLPFYAAGTLPKAEAARLERHLSHCDACRRSLNDWRLVAAAVRAEAASQLRDLPPLSPDVMRVAAGQMHNPRMSVNTVSFAPQPVRGQEPPRRASSTPITLAVAAFTVLLLGGLLVLMALRLTPTEQGSNGVVLMPSATPSEAVTETAPTEILPLIVVIEPSNTPTPPMQDVPSQVPPTSAAPPTVNVPTQIPATPVPPTFVMPTPIAATPEPTTDGSMTFAQVAIGGGGGCTLQAAIPSGSVINMYAQPRIDSTVLTTISSAELLTGLAMSDNSWFRLQSERGNVGWVQQGLLSVSGNCDGLPLIFAQDATNAVTPTETVLPFPTLEATLNSGASQGQNTPATDSAPPLQS